MSQSKYIYSVWRRKCSSAVVKLFPKWTGKSVIRQWEKIVDLSTYFWWHSYMVEDIFSPFKIISDDASKKFDVEVVVRGWWLKWQAASIRLWISRWLVKYNEDNRKLLKPYWLLKRDPRVKERKKPWLKKARKSPQRSKR